MYHSVILPSHLMDVSFLAECFKPYGAHPYNAIIKRISPINHSAAILLGNLANFFFDELIHSPTDSLDYKDMMHLYFRNNPFEIAITVELDDLKLRKLFIEESRRQFDNISCAIRESLNTSKYGLHQNNLIVEPSFISFNLGLQGRLDAISSNLSSFLELKSGRMNDYNNLFLAHENHVIQLQLYAALISEIEEIESKGYLFYSRYPCFVYNKLDREIVNKGLILRNKIIEFDLQIYNSIDNKLIRQIFQSISPELLNEKGLSNRFWEQYLSAPIKHFAKLYNQLNENAEDFFLETYRFILKEWYITKSGSTEDCYLIDGRRLGKCVSLSFKVNAGEAIDSLFVVEYMDEKFNATTELISYVRLRTNNKALIAHSNFRRGDLVWLYPHSNLDTENLNRSIIKGVIISITSLDITIQLQYVLRNASLLNSKQQFVLEHGESEVNQNAYFHGLYYFLDANSQRRSLLLGESSPRTHLKKSISLNSQSDIERILEKVDKFKDYFLLVGPPGSGKTSIALRSIVEQECKKTHTHILVLAFTNRAVDEICASLHSLHDTYPIIRMGSLAACDPRYVHLHYTKQFDEVSNRHEVITRIEKYRIVISTVSSFISKIHLFQFYRYDLAIIDEASQILEPQLLSALCSKYNNGDNLIERWVMIGDHKQLPAVVAQSELDAEIISPRLHSLGFISYKESMFERLFRKVSSENRTECFDQIFTQGRMHPEVADYTNQFYYQGKLNTVPLNHQIETDLYSIYSNEGLEYLLATNRTIFFNVPSDGIGPLSKQNETEARYIKEIVCKICDLYMKNGIDFNPQESIGIITPFRNQISLIRDELQKVQNPQFDQISIDTVERYQGSQRDIIVFSFCISHPHQVNWIASPIEIEGCKIDRKLNVTLTRAKKQYILLGNKEILSSNDLFSHFIEYLQRKECKFEVIY